MRPPRLPLNWQKIPNSNWSRIFLIILLIRVHSHTNRNHKLPSIYPTLSQHHWSALSTIHFSPPSSFPLSLRMLSRLHLTSSILLRSTPWQPLFSAPLSFSDYELRSTSPFFLKSTTLLPAKRNWGHREGHWGLWLGYVASTKSRYFIEKSITYLKGCFAKNNVMCLSRQEFDK